MLFVFNFTDHKVYAKQLRWLHFFAFGEFRKLGPMAVSAQSCWF